MENLFSLSSMSLGMSGGTDVVCQGRAASMDETLLANLYFSQAILHRVKLQPRLKCSFVGEIACWSFLKPSEVLQGLYLFVP